MFKALSDWIVIEGYCATRVIKGTDPSQVKNRVAFIEKSPRVRINKNEYCIEQKGGKYCVAEKNDAWLYSYKGDDGFNKESRKWCDDMLKLLGWE